MRWLNLDDWRAVWQLQASGTQLDLERAVLWPHTPLQAAWRAPWPFSPIGAETIVLYPSASSARALGFAQVRARHGRPEADVVFLAPALDSCADAVSIWYRLLAECTQVLGGRGGQRLFAQVASGDGAEEVFRQAGFVTYAREGIYRLNQLPPDLSRREMRLRRQRARDGWDLLRMYAQLTPRPVQIAEGMLSPEGQGGKVGEWWDQSRGAGFILQVEGELVGAARVRRGRAAYWLRLGLSAPEQSDALLRGALASLWAAPRRPIYCGVRDYESGLTDALGRAGFERLGERALMVKHITARAKEPLIPLIPTLEKRAEPAASASHPVG